MKPTKPGVCHSYTELAELALGIAPLLALSYLFLAGIYKLIAWSLS